MMVVRFCECTVFALVVILAAGYAEAEVVVETFDPMPTWMIDTSGSPTDELVLDYEWVDIDGDKIADSPGTVHQPWSFARWGASITDPTSTNRQIKSKTVKGEGVLEIKALAGGTTTSYAYASIFGDDSAYGPAGSSFAGLSEIRVDTYKYTNVGTADLAWLIRDAATTAWYISGAVPLTSTGDIDTLASSVSLLDWYAVDSVVAANMNLFASGDEDTTTALANGSALPWGDWDVDGVGIHIAKQSHQTLRFDNLTLDTIPEPMTVVLLGLGGLALLRRRGF